LIERVMILANVAGGEGRSSMRLRAVDSYYRVARRAGSPRGSIAFFERNYFSQRGTIDMSLAEGNERAWGRPNFKTTIWALWGGAVKGTGGTSRTLVNRGWCWAHSRTGEAEYARGELRPLRLKLAPLLMPPFHPRRSPAPGATQILVGTPRSHPARKK